MKEFLQVFNPSQYEMNPYVLAPLMVASLALMAFFICFRIDKKSVLNKAVGVVCLASAVWLFGFCLMVNSKDIPISFFWAHMMYLGIILTPPSLFQMSSCCTGRQQKQGILTLSLYFIALIIFIGETYFLIDIPTSYFGWLPFNLYEPTGLLHFILLCYVLSIMNLIFAFFQLSESSEREKIRVTGILLLIYFISYMEILARYNITQTITVGFIAILGFVMGSFFFVFRNQWLEIQNLNARLEDEIEEKALEISQIGTELRAIQLKLFETGKISAVASLSAGILHQISQPITAIHGFVKFIKKEMNPTETFYKPICLMEEQSQYLKEMLTDLMELIRHREIKKDHINVNTCINRSLNLLTDELRIRRINWDLELDENLPAVYADSVHLQQVFMNVAINAMQAMSTLPRGAIRYLKISSQANKAKKEVLITFKDSGPGLSVQDKQQIFEPFFSTKTTGTGIGLALCKDLIAEHGGTIDVLSQPGDGATFLISLPFADDTLKNNGVKRI